MRIYLPDEEDIWALISKAPAIRFCRDELAPPAGKTAPPLDRQREALAGVQSRKVSRRGGRPRRTVITSLRLSSDLKASVYSGETSASLRAKKGFGSLIEAFVQAFDGFGVANESF